MAATGRFDSQMPSPGLQGAFEMTQVLLDIAGFTPAQKGQFRKGVRSASQPPEQLFPEHVHPLLTRYPKNLMVTAFAPRPEMAKRKPGFEDQLKELETIVERLEKGDVSLEESLKLFEKGVQLARACQKALQDAEQKVQVLTRGDDESFQLEPLPTDDQQ